MGMFSEKVDAVLQWPIPKSVKEIQQLLGLANFYRRFIQGYSRIIIAVTSLLRKDAKFDISAKVIASFEAIKQEFVKASFLQHFQPDLETVIEIWTKDYSTIKV